MTKKYRDELAHNIADLVRDIRLLEDITHALDGRIDGLAARLERTQIQAMTTERAWATPAQPRRRLLNNSWPLRRGDGYPRFDTTRHEGPLGGYESYVRQSPPATD